ncbi:Thiol-disulfide isomerase and thioredoxin [Pseudomonas syringae pv. primulae]|nr:Thiol-disulfide isomerase and thioredoxin [Pseudomonas syringae pv. primulae]
MMLTPPECQLFSTLGCPLCEVAEAVLLPFAIEHGLMVELIDIGEHEQLLERYELRVPVLRRIDTGEELEWPFEAPQVVFFLSR